MNLEKEKLIRKLYVECITHPDCDKCPHDKHCKEKVFFEEYTNKQLEEAKEDFKI